MSFLAGIFLCSASAISFEIALTRVFSISLWYHFAFMVVSIAMLGIGLSGTVMSLYPRLRERRPGTYALFLAASMPAGYLLSNLVPFDPVRLSWDRAQLLYIGLYYLLLSVPFFFFGLIMSGSFARLREKSGSLYAADLLGAGAGSLAVIAVMGMAGPGRSVLIMASAALAGAFLLGRRVPAVALLAINLAVIVAYPGFMKIRMSPYKRLEQALRYPGAEHIRTYYSGFSRVDVFRSPMVRFAPGLSLRYMGGLPRQIGLSVDGADINAITEADGEEFLKFLPSALPYETGKRRSALIIDPGGGLQVLMARRYGVENIRSAESNPLVVEVIGGDFGDFSGHIYGEDTWKGLARSRLGGTAEKYDVVDISLMGATPSALYGIAEDYRFTVEAFEQYLARLDQDGVLGVSLFLLPPPRTELRLLATALKALEEAGVRETERRIAAIRSWGSLTILVKAAPFTEGEISLIKGFSRKMGFDLVYYPGIRESESNIYAEMPENEYFRAFRAIIDPATREGFEENYAFDIRPVRDDAPFFHYYLKLRNIGAIYRLAGGKWQYFLEEGYLLPAVLLQVALLSALVLLLPALRATSGKRAGPVRKEPLVYFALLGVGFMFVEVPLIQKMILPLENPSYAVAAVLASLLVASGAGSLSSQRLRLLRTPYTVAAASAVAAAYGLLLPGLARDISAYPLDYKILLSFAVIFPAGFLMGIPFPLGMRHTEEAMIPWAWAVNGCLSVVAPVLAVIVAMGAGFKAVILLGALAYALAFLSLRGFSRKEEAG